MKTNLGPASPPTWTIVLAFATLYIAWGTTYLAVRFGVQEEGLPPCLFSGTRVLLAGLILLAFLIWKKENVRLTGRDWLRIAMTGWLFFLGGNGLMTLAQTHLDSGVAAILAATIPVWVAILELFHPGGDRLNWRGWMGLMLGMAGVVFMLAPEIDLGSMVGVNAGPILVFGSCICWAAGSLFWRYNHASCSHFVSAAYKMIIGGATLALIGVSLGEVGDLPKSISPGALFSFVYLLVVGSLLGYLAFNFLLHHVSTAQVGTYAYVNPLVAVFLGWLWGEPLTAWILGGIAFILTGVVLVRQGSKSPGVVTQPLPQTPSEPALPFQPVTAVVNLSR
jgi:drug/metabolite transporter (DMT)-like permease